MANYTTIEIQSLAILTLFLLYFIVKLRRFFKQFTSKSLLKRNRTLKKLKRLSWETFEHLTMELFRNKGWHVTGNTKKGADGGVDIWLQKKSLTQKNISAIVQCKRYENARVTIKVIREMYGLMHEYGVDEVYIVTTSRFTKECNTFIKDKNITLIDGEQLVKQIATYA
ncbi:MAG: restriction endonuclease [Sulfurovum sp.]|nr:MAG: restriction endonuclease [Sulfurovum sp.]RUM73481.1 MAG: restriction endonuclease [Sulfurovum sp.]